MGWPNLVGGTCVACTPEVPMGWGAELLQLGAFGGPFPHGILCRCPEAGGQWLSEGGPQTSGISITWKLVEMQTLRLQSGPVETDTGEQGAPSPSA